MAVSKGATVPQDILGMLFALVVRSDPRAESDSSP
jgi:hypothetical protein